MAFRRKAGERDRARASATRPLLARLASPRRLSLLAGACFGFALPGLGHAPLLFCAHLLLALLFLLLPDLVASPGFGIPLPRERLPLLLSPEICLVLALLFRLPLRLCLATS